jgi:hypothetical protein
MSNKISESLGLEPVYIRPPVKTVNSAEENDFEFTRRNLYDIISKGQDALEDMLDVAKQSESPRAFEVASTLINTLVNANKDLMGLRKTKKELEKGEDREDPKTVNNNLFIGSSAELLKMIKDNSNENIQ